MARARGSKNLTLEGCDYRPVASKPAQRERVPQVPSKTTVQWFEGRPDCEPSKPADAKSRGQPTSTPQRPY
jgi:hypothetical protein